MADTKNFGLKGVGNDIQLGKAGSRINLSGSAIQARNAADGAYVIFKGLTPVADEDFATKLYVDNVAAGLDPKESCQAATTASGIGTYATSPSNGQFTSVAVSIDGVTLAQGDRVLVKNQVDATQNGIYEVQATTTTLTRSSDMDGTPSSEVSAGNFTFVEAGTVNADTGWVLQGDGILTLNTDNLDWVQFSGTGTILAGTGLIKSGATIDLDFVGGTGMTNTVATAVGDFIAFSDTSATDTMQLRSWTNILADLNIVTAAANGMLVRTSANNYASRTITASAIAGAEGISIVSGSGVSGNPTIGLDITGLTNASTNATNTDTLVLSDGTNNLEYTVLELSNAPAFATSAVTQIIAGDTSVTVTDTGSDGTITTNADGSTIIVSDVTGSTFTVDSAATAVPVTVVTLSASSTGTPAAGLGPALDFLTETAAGGPGNQEIGVQIASEITDVTGASEDFDVVFYTMAGGATAAERARISSTGVVTATSFNGVALTAGGAATNFLDETGSYTALTSNATHTGQVTGSTALALDITAVTAQPASGAIIATDTIIINDGGTLSEATFTQMDTYFNSSLTFSTGTVTSSGSPLNNQVAVFTTGTDIDSNANFTWDASILALTGAMDITGDLDVDNININGNTVSTTTGDLIIQSTGTSSVIINDGGGDPILELNNTVSAINGLAISAGATGNPGQITTGTGSEANIDIGFLTNGTGAISVVAGTGNYEDNVTADDDIPNKRYVDDLVAATGGSGTLDSVVGTVDLTTASTQNIGAAAGIPASCTILSVTLDVTTLSDASTTVTVGDATNGAASYMAATENDPTAADIYIADGRLANGAGTRQATATVAVNGTVGAATCIITFRHV